MPEGILRFKLPEEQYDHNCAINGWKYRHVLSNLDQELRSKIKYGNFPEETIKVYQEIRDWIRETTYEYNLGDIHGED